jgi:hypothetical protein
MQVQGRAVVGKGMGNDFLIISEFLARTGAEVVGRGDAHASDLKEELEEFVAGNCTEKEKAALCEKLRDDPAGLAWLAAKVKERREDGAGEKLP